MTNTRRNFLKGLTASAAAMVATPLITKANDNVTQLEPLTKEQQRFMDNYEKWMDEFSVFIERQKVNPADVENNKQLLNLSKQSEAFQNQLKDYLKDENFALTFQAKIDRISRMIE